MLFAMGGYGTYLGFRIRFSDDVVRYYCNILLFVIKKNVGCFSLSLIP